MGWVSSNIAKVPAVNGAGEAFTWFVFLLPGPFTNQFRQELLDNFFKLSNEVGTQSLVVVGEDFDHFHRDVMRTYRMELYGYDRHTIPLPSLLVTDTAPANVQVYSGSSNARIMLFPLEETALKEGMLSNFLRQLCLTLQDSQAFEEVSALGREKMIEKWGWIPRYFNYKPNFFGFDLNLTAILTDILKNCKG